MCLLDQPGTAAAIIPTPHICCSLSVTTAMATSHRSLVQLSAYHKRRDHLCQANRRQKPATPLDVAHLYSALLLKRCSGVLKYAALPVAFFSASPPTAPGRLAWQAYASRSENGCEKFDVTKCQFFSCGRRRVPSDNGARGLRVDEHLVGVRACAAPDTATRASTAYRVIASSRELASHPAWLLRCTAVPCWPRRARGFSCTHDASHPHTPQPTLANARDVDA